MCKIKDFIYDFGLELGTDFLIDKKKERELQNRLKEYVSLQSNVNEALDLNEEIDFDSISKYIIKDILIDSRRFLFDPQVNKKLVIEEILSKVHNICVINQEYKSDKIKNIIKGALDIIYNFYLENISDEQLFVSAMLKNEIVKDIVENQETLNKDLKEYIEKQNEAIIDKINSNVSNINQKNIFFIYDEIDTEIANKICNVLEDNFLLQCYFHNRDYFYDNFTNQELNNIISNCPIILVLLTENTTLSCNFNKELQFSLNNDNIFIPVVMGCAKINEEIKNIIFDKKIYSISQINDISKQVFSILTTYYEEKSNCNKNDEQILFDKLIEDKFTELLQSKKEEINDGLEYSPLSERLINSILEKWGNKDKKQNYFSLDEFWSIINKNKGTFDGTSTDHEKKSSAITEYVKHFSLVDAIGTITIVFRIYELLDIENMTLSAYAEQVDYMEEEVEEGISRTYFVNDVEPYDEEFYLILLTIDDCHKCVLLNTGVLSDKLIISKKPIIIEFEDFRIKDFNNTMHSYCYFETDEQNELKNQNWITSLNFRTLVIDLIDKKAVLRKIFYDSHEKMWKADIKLEPKKAYLALQILYEDEPNRPASYFDIGMGYYWGIYGLYKNNYKAAKWFEESGTPKSFFYLANIYYFDSLLADIKESFKYMTLAAKGEFKIAQYYLGIMYKKGIGCKKNNEDAIMWFLKAAEQGYLDAQIEIAEQYYYGEMIEKNYEESFRWYFKAAENGSDEAKFYVGYMYYEGKGIKRDYKEAFYWLSKSNDLSANNILADMYFYGLECEQNYSEAARLYALSAMQNDITGINNLGKMYLYGYGVEVDYIKAATLFEEAADKGSREAYENLGDMYAEGLKFKKDISIAIQMYQKAINLGNEKASIKLDKLKMK